MMGLNVITVLTQSVYYVRECVMCIYQAYFIKCVTQAPEQLLVVLLLDHLALPSEELSVSDVTIKLTISTFCSLTTGDKAVLDEGGG